MCWAFDPHGVIGFEEGLLALLEKPDMVKYLLDRMYHRTLERVKVLADLGCHGYVGSETYCSADILSPDTFGEVIFPALRRFYQGVRALGIHPICYFTGNHVCPFSTGSPSLTSRHCTSRNQRKLLGLMSSRSASVLIRALRLLATLKGACAAAVGIA